ncbi:4'-phosphopantetheinyl transferase family protein [Winogradskyella sp.]|uniref:4'-phosphopantetheinyl transferase family protein n=1 Tax=Winogradskyella sp. TaxID=1883156 RepID=UPI003BA84AC1
MDDGHTFFFRDHIPHIWVLNINSEIKHLNFFEGLLSKDEKIKAHKFKFEKDKRVSIIARGALRVLLGKYLDISPEKIVFKYGDYGKPEFKNWQNLKFNTSHAKDLVVFGFTKNSEIGIDVEYCKSNFDVMDIVDNYFSKKEIEAIHKIPKHMQTQAFYRGWTRKEAFIKAKAKGLSFPLDAFSVSIESDNQSKLEETLWDSNEKHNWSIIPFETLDNYKAAIAIQERTMVVDLFEFGLKQINHMS